MLLFISLFSLLFLLHEIDGVFMLNNIVINNENIFEQLMEACKVCSIGQITEALFKVGGQYRRNM